MTAVTTEMNISNNRHATKYRKIAVSYRDSQLLPVFRFALSTLQNTLQISGIVMDSLNFYHDYSPCSYHQRAASFNIRNGCELLASIDRGAEKLKESILVLMRTCLSFDFIGTLPDESSDDVGSIQVPATWRSVFEEPGYLDVLWECWKKFNGPSSVLVMETLSQAAAIRRSLFSNDEARLGYIHHIMRETVLTLKSAAGQNKLQDIGNFHEFCRMLSKFRSTFQLPEVCDFKDFQQWISLVGDFTSRGFHSWKASVPTVKSSDRSTMECLGCVLRHINVIFVTRVY